MRFIRLYPSTAATIDNDRALAKLSPNAPKPADPLQGTWVFNDTLDMTANSVTRAMINIRINLDFTSNGSDYTIMRMMPSMKAYLFYGSTMSGRVYSAGSWSDDNYKTITINSLFEDISVESSSSFITTPEEFLSWLQFNATRQ